MAVTAPREGEVHVPGRRCREIVRTDDTGFPVEMIMGIAVVGTPEEIDITNAPGLGKSLADAAAGGNGTLVVDMSRTQFCDTAGIHALVAAHRRAAGGGGRLLLVTAGMAVQRIFSITGLDQVIASFASLEEALAAASSGAA
jgi:anti-sigma B factor antagonist